jgi:hypothetical protein
MSTRFANSYSKGFCVSLVIQGVVVALAAKSLFYFHDRVFYLAFGFYWLGFLAVVLTQPQSPKRWRVWYITVGFVLWFFAAAALVPLIYKE